MEGLLRDANTVGENPTLALNMFARTKRQSKTSFVLISKLLFITKYKINRSNNSSIKSDENGKL